MKKVITWGNGTTEMVDIAPVPVEIPVKYFNPDLPELEYIGGGKSDWIDLRARGCRFIAEGTFAMVNLNVAMELPEGYEAIVAPRSSIFKNFGLIMANSIGIIDEIYRGDDDEWMCPVYCVPGYGKHWAYKDESGLQVVSNLKDVPSGVAPIKGTWVTAGDRLCQFRIVEHQPSVSFKEVRSLGNKSRGGFGTTGTK